MFHLIGQFVFSALVLIYALIPGHNFGLAIIVFTIIIRLLMWPLVKKQLHHAKAIRELQPEIKKIKAATKGNRQKESQLTMELYKEKEINPFSSLGIIILQIPILIGLFFAVRRIADDPSQIVSYSYNFLHNFGALKELAANIHLFDATLFGVVDLTQKAIGANGIYWPAVILVACSAVAQFYQSKQLMPKSADARSLKQIFREAGKGKTAEQQEVTAAIGQSMLYMIPGMVFIFGLTFPAALPLYWLVNSGIAFLQQTKILADDVKEAEALADEPEKPKKAKAASAPVASEASSKNQTKRRTKKSHKRRKR